MNKFKVKENTHLVIKIEDINEYLTDYAQVKLAQYVSTIGAFRKLDSKNPDNSYYVVNKDEPYAEEVMEVIRRGELKKNG